MAIINNEAIIRVDAPIIILLDNIIYPDAYDASFAHIARQFRNGYHIHDFQPPLPYYYSLLQSLGVNTYPLSYYQRIENAYRFQPVNLWIRLLNFRERNSRFRSRPRNNHEDDYGHVLKYLKIRTHHAPEVVAPDVESDTCVICQSEYEHEENIGALQCGHEYHTDCIKKWLTKKKDCPMCRATVLPSKEQRL